MVSWPSFAPRRTSNHIILHLSPSQPAPSLPFELHGSIAPDVWATRLPVIATTAGRYSKPMFERIWLIIGFLATLFVPMALHRVIYGVFRAKADEQLDLSDVYDLRAKTHAVTGAIFLGLGLLFFLPLIIWKAVGSMQIKKLLKRWTDADHKNGLSSSCVSDWSVKTPGVFSNAIILSIRLPPNVVSSSFHPDAYLPSYINAAVDADANYYYPYKAEPGLPRMSVVGNIPLYHDEKRGFHDLKV